MSDPQPNEKQHRTNVTKTELTDNPEEQGSHRWAERRGQASDEANAARPADEEQ